MPYVLLYNCFIIFLGVFVESLQSIIKHESQTNYNALFKACYISFYALSLVYLVNAIIALPSDTILITLVFIAITCTIATGLTQFKKWAWWLGIFFILLNLAFTYTAGKTLLPIGLLYCLFITPLVCLVIIRKTYWQVSNAIQISATDKTTA
jgi:hypothetical protein